MLSTFFHLLDRVICDLFLLNFYGLDQGWKDTE
jgi:hypothetical protein